MASEPATAEGKRLAITAEALYLANLLVLPLFAFMLLLLLHLRHADSAPVLATVHLSQTINASLWAGLLLVPLPLLTIILAGGSLGGWTVVILWFVVCHAALVLAGAVGLAQAMAGRPWRYPLIGGRGTA